MTPTRLRFTSLAALMLLGLSTSAFAQSRSTYIVQLAAEPVASYTGTVPGYSATLPAPGTRLNTRSSAALAYKAYLDAQQTTVASLIAGAPIVARYSTVYNGFAARLTAAEVQALRTSPLVVEVFADEARKLNTISTPAFLGLSTAGGVWSQTVAGLALKGEDIIIGVVDSGIWPENPSFADRVNGSTPVFGTGTLAYGPAPAGWNGSCMGGEGFTPATHCNNKLIGAQYFNAGFLSSGLPKHWTESYSPRDSVAGPTGHGGHGSHTASTAGGNSGAPVTLGGNSVGTASGIAPRARIAAYKVCYTYINPNAEDGTGSQNSCFTSDSVAATPFPLLMKPSCRALVGGYYSAILYLLAACVQRDELRRPRLPRGADQPFPKPDPQRAGRVVRTCRNSLPSMRRTGWRRCASRRRIRSARCP